MKLYINKNLKTIKVLTSFLDIIDSNFQPTYCTALEVAINMKKGEDCIYIDYQNKNNLMIINSLNNDVCFFDTSCIIDISKSKLVINITSPDLLEYYSNIVSYNASSASSHKGIKEKHQEKKLCNE